MVDLCRPGHLTACLRNFQEATGCSDENWESQFGVPLLLWTALCLLCCMVPWAAHAGRVQTTQMLAMPMQAT